MTSINLSAIADNIFSEYESDIDKAIDQLLSASTHQEKRDAIKRLSQITVRASVAGDAALVTERLRQLPND